MIHIQNPVYQTHSAILWHIQNPVLLLHIQNLTIFRVLPYLEPNIYSELCQGILRNVRILRTLPYSELCRILNSVVFKTKTYLESCLFRHMQLYSDTFNNDSYNNISFLLFTVILRTFQRNLKKHWFFDYNDVIFNAGLGLHK